MDSTTGWRLGVAGAAGLALLVTLACGGTPEEVRGARAAIAQDQVAARSGAPVPTPGTAWVIFGHDTVRAEVARTADERGQGLRNRDALPDGAGMLFVFGSSRMRSFWMRNTYIPLDIAFLDGELRIVDIQQMEPEAEEFHESAAPAMFALEVPQGWFEARGIEVGAVAEVVFGG